MAMWQGLGWYPASNVDLIWRLRSETTDAWNHRLDFKAVCDNFAYHNSIHAKTNQVHRGLVTYIHVVGRRSRDKPRNQGYWIYCCAAVVRRALETRKKIKIKNFRFLFFLRSFYENGRREKNGFGGDLKKKTEEWHLCKLQWLGVGGLQSIIDHPFHVRKPGPFLKLKY